MITNKLSQVVELYVRGEEVSVRANEEEDEDEGESLQRRV